jgi:membrane-bound serine protease (ClpP class)
MLVVGVCGLAVRAFAAPDAGPPAEAASAVSPAGEAAAEVGQPPPPRVLPEIPKGGRVVVVPVSGTIDLGLAPFLDRVTGSLGERDLLVLDINTFGGRVDAAVVIRDRLLHAKARTVCWVNPRAISAGALISYACDVIAVARGASIGAATPIQIGGDGAAKPVEEKMVSYMRSEMRATAEAKGRSGLIAEAMVDASIVVPGLDDKDKLLTLDGEQARTWGVAELFADSEPELWKALGVEPARVERPGISGAERIARFLSDPVISGLLMSLGMLGILLELYSGGHGIALVAGLSCLALFFFGHHVALHAGWEEMLLFALGAALIAVEILVPGHILPGVLGVMLVITSLVMALVNLESIPLGVAWRAGWLQHALASVFGSLLVTTAGAFAMARWLPRTRLGRSLILDTRLAATAATPIASDLQIGQRGEATTDLRPAGKARFGDRRVDVVLESGHVQSGGAVEIVAVERQRVVVREVRS